MRLEAQVYIRSSITNLNLPETSVDELHCGSKLSGFDKKKNVWNKRRQYLVLLH